MNTSPYSAKVRKLFAAPAHAGKLENGTVESLAGQDVRVRFSARAVDGSVEAVRFGAWGCPHVIAAAEMICRQLEGGPVTDLEKFTAARIMEDLAIPTEKTGRILVLEDAVRSLGRRLG